MDMVGRNEQPREEPKREPHEERQGGGGGGLRNKEDPIFGNRRRVMDSPLNIIGEQHDLLVLPKGALKEFLGDGTIDAKIHLNLFLDVCDFHRVEYDNVMVRYFFRPYQVEPMNGIRHYPVVQLAHLMTLKPCL
jgi:hypothetical protein